MDALFEKYANLIRKRAHEYSEKLNIDYEEMEAQGFLIYCRCLEEYDASRAGFCTYLYTQLNRLGDFARTYIRQKGVLIQDYYSEGNPDDKKDYEQNLVARELSPEVEDFLVEAKSELSDEAYQLLVWIIKREWEHKNKRTPTISMAVKHFNHTRQVIEGAWEECKNFWCHKGLAFYA